MRADLSLTIWPREHDCTDNGVAQKEQPAENGAMTIVLVSPDTEGNSMTTWLHLAFRTQKSDSCFQVLRHWPAFRDLTLDFQQGATGTNVEGQEFGGVLGCSHNDRGQSSSPS